ncbi:MAG: alanine--tRNA ligase [Planctomycetes bacterium]|nr:alanine--tRNA ligase [Planctomycetota bacterium]
MLTSQEIRSAFINFFKDRGHKFVPSSSVAPIGDPTLMFTNAGMNQFKDIFLGLSKSECKSAVNTQKCIRVSGKHNDLEEVGIDTYHHTFFEMLGNWSFDDYFKEDTIKWAWELLTDVYKIDESKLWATVFAGDEEDGSEYDKEAAQLWAKVTSINPDRILACGKKDNFWEMGASGPCGPCSEIHIDLGEGRCDMQHIEDHVCEVNAGCSRYIELWNLVFIQYNRQEDGSLVKLPARYIDTGAGLERIAAVLQNKKSNYDTDLFMPIINAIAEITTAPYTSQLNFGIDNAFRVIADHARALTFAITDGVTPSNEGRGYVLRRLLRRAARFGRQLDINGPFMYSLVDVVVDNMGTAYPELNGRAEFVKTVIKSEEESFGKTLDRGLDIFEKAAETARKTSARLISGQDAFQMYDTYGFPLDLTELMARERDLSVDTATFEQFMDEQRQRARDAQKSSLPKFTFGNAELPPTNDTLKYKTVRCDAKVIGLMDFDGYHEKGSFGRDDSVRLNVDYNYVEKDDHISLVLDETCFYVKAGGQVGDIGKIESDDFSFKVTETEKLGDCIAHWGKLVSGTITVDAKVTAMVDKKFRDAVTKNHTATHILQWALQQTLGDGVHQQGSLVNPDYLRFDFTFPKALTHEQLSSVELLVRTKIAEALPVSFHSMAIDDAKSLGAMALFGEKYGDTVRVVAIGTKDENGIRQSISKEFCGGIHVDNTAAIGGFKIVKEESISAGVRRITALTGRPLLDYLVTRSDIVDELTQTLKAPSDQIAARVGKLLDDNKRLAKELKNAAKAGGTDVMAAARKLLESAEKVGDASVITGVLKGAKVDDLRGAIDMLKKTAKSAAIVLGASEGDSKVILIAGVTDDLIKRGVKAGDIIKEIAPIVGGGGGGRPQMAQAGGKNPAKLDEAMTKAKQLIKEKLG